jgi:rRNA biogenesis protein RRP5
MLKQSLSVDVVSKKVEMSFRSGDITKESASTRTLADFSEGQKVNGRVKKIEDYGLFIEIEGCKISGLCHKSQVCLCWLSTCPFI